MIVKPIRISNPYRFLRKRQLTLGIGRLGNWLTVELGLIKIFCKVKYPQFPSQPITKGN